MSSYILTSPIDIFSSGTNAQINLFSAGSSFSAQITAPTALASTIDFTLPSTSGSTGKYLQRTGASSLGWSLPGNTGSMLPINIRTYSTATVGLNTTSTTLAFGFTFMFPGTTALGASPTAYVGYAGISANTTGRIQIVDITTPPGTNIIVDYIAGPNGAPLTLVLYNMGALSNLSTGAAIWQVNFSKSGGSNGAFLIFFKLIK